MPFRARINPASLVRRQAAARQFAIPRAPIFLPPRPAAALRAGSSFSTTAPSLALGGFFNRKNASAPSAEAFVSSLAAGIKPSTAGAYDELVKQLSSNPRAPRLDADDLALLLEKLAAARPVESLTKLLDTVFFNLKPVHGVQPDERHVRAMVRGLARSGRTERALELARAELKAMRIEEWEALIAGAAAGASRPSPSDPLLLEIITLATETTNDERLLAPILGQLSQSKEASLSLSQDWVSSMASHGVTTGPRSEAHLAVIAARAGEADKASTLVSSWSSQDADSSLRRLRDDAALETLIAKDDVSGVTALVRQMAGDASPRALSYLVMREAAGQPDSIIMSIDKVQNAVGRDLPSEAWGNIIIEAPSLSSAWAIYAEAKNRRVILDPRGSEVLIAQLCQQAPPQLVPAMQVYSDTIVGLEAADLEITRDLFTPLFIASSSVQPPSPDTAITLAEDMKRIGVTLHAQEATNAILKLMKEARDHFHAYNIYDRIQAVSAPLDASQYDAIIIAFIKFSCPDSAVAPPDLVLSMMNHMRQQGYNPGTRILTSLLKSYAILGRQIRQRRVNPNSSLQAFQTSALIVAIRDIHSLTSLDPSIAIDVPLLTALMDAFSNAGGFVETFEVWDEIVRLRPTVPAKDALQLFAPAVSVIIDTCGYAELLPRARKIWGWATRHGLNSDQNTWASWAECLSRLGKYDEALDVLCDQMGRDGVPPPTVRIASLPVKFASSRQPSQLKGILARLRKRYPDWASELTAIARAKYPAFA